MKVFFTLNEKSCVLPAADWSETIVPAEDWYVGEIDGAAYEEHGIPIWAYQNGECVRRTDEEIQSDIDALPVPEPTDAELLRADIDYLLMLAEE